tara:strand:- start:216 stop:386 length:171 start_codon:yes stop_codon:yes gene_type:complete
MKLQKNDAKTMSLKDKMRHSTPSFEMGLSTTKDKECLLQFFATMLGIGNQESAATL